MPWGEMGSGPTTLHRRRPKITYPRECHRQGSSLNVGACGHRGYVGASVYAGVLQTVTLHGDQAQENPFVPTVSRFYTEPNSG